MGDRFEVQIPARHQKAFRDAGLWPDRRLTEYLDDAVARDAEAPAVVGYDSRFEAPLRLTYGELDRLATHITAAGALLSEGGAIGRKLDFLAQELNREANTLCAKSNDAELSEIGLELKAVIDQFREQVQNIE